MKGVKGVTLGCSALIISDWFVWSIQLYLYTSISWYIFAIASRAVFPVPFQFHVKKERTHAAVAVFVSLSQCTILNYRVPQNPKRDKRGQHDWLRLKSIVCRLCAVCVGRASRVVLGAALSF